MTKSRFSYRSFFTSFILIEGIYLLGIFFIWKIVPTQACISSLCLDLSKLAIYKTIYFNWQIMLVNILPSFLLSYLRVNTYEIFKQDIADRIFNMSQSTKYTMAYMGFASFAGAMALIINTVDTTVLFAMVLVMSIFLIRQHEMRSIKKAFRNGKK